MLDKNTWDLKKKTATVRVRIQRRRSSLRLKRQNDSITYTVLGQKHIEDSQ